MHTFKIVVGLQNCGEFQSFGDAFRAFWQKVKELVFGGVSYQVLETAVWVELVQEDGSSCVMDFFQVKDFAYRNGLVVGDGELAPGATEPSFEVVEFEFSEVHKRNVAGYLRSIS